MPEIPQSRPSGACSFVARVLDQRGFNWINGLLAPLGLDRFARSAAGPEDLKADH